MWNERKSLVLSKLCVIAFMVCLAAALVGGPWLVKWLTTYSINAKQQYYPLFMTTLYSGGAVAAVLLYALYRLLHNISKGAVFERINITYLRRMSWCCFFGAGIALLSWLYYLPWLIVAVAAAFMGLIVRVVKNMMEQAVLLKQENDFTI